jgi:O-antigen ligase
MPKINYFFIVFTLIFALLAPSIPITDTFSLRMEFVLVPLFLVFNILGNRKVTKIGSPIPKWFFLFMMGIFISIVYAFFVMQYAFRLNDLFELIKSGLYLLIFYFAASSFISISQAPRLYNAILTLFIISAIFGIMQYFNVFDINHVITPIYAPTQLRAVINTKRVVGTTSNPNDFGILMLLGVCLGLASFFYSKSRSKILLAILTIVLCLTGVFFTTSRISIVASLISVIYISFIGAQNTRKFNRNSTIRFFLITIGVLSLLLLLYNAMPESWHVRLSGLLNISQDVSFNARIDKWEDFWVLFQQSPIFGWGPGKGLIIYTIDNEWYLILLRYGAVGVLTILLMGRSFFMTAAKASTRTPISEVKALSVALKGFIPAAALFMVTASVYHYQQLMGVLLILIGLCYNLGRIVPVTPPANMFEVYPRASSVFQINAPKHRVEELD